MLSASGFPPDVGRRPSTRDLATRRIEISEGRNDIDWRVRASELAIDTRPLLAGHRVKFATEPEAFTTTSPFDGQPIASYPICNTEDVSVATGTAMQAFATGSWSRMSFGERAEVFARWSDLILDHAQSLALFDTIEMGMPITQSEEDVRASAAMLRSLGALATAITTDAGATRPGATCVNYLEPLGVVAVFTPWNFPVNQALAKIGPPLIMGNSLVHKPSEIAPASALRLADLALEAGLPESILSVLTGPGEPTGAALAATPDVAKISFTGSERAGAAVQRAGAASGQPKPMAMELGGKSPHVVCPSFIDEVADIAPTIAHSAFWNAGQVCAAGSRLIAHVTLADKLLGALCREAERFKPGDPLDACTRVGPIATRHQYEAVIGFMRRAELTGARPLIGGVDASKALGRLFVAPTIYDAVDPDSELACEEIFGPVLALTRFTSIDDAVKHANRSRYGLAATVWTRDLIEGHRLARDLVAATVTINGRVEPPSDFAAALGYEPAGRSGFGRDFGKPGLEQFARLKLAMFNAGS